MWSRFLELIVMQQKFKATVLVGDDTNLLISLIFYADLNAKDFFAPDQP